MSRTRRTVLRTMSMAAARYLSGSGSLRADPLNQPIGLQLYTVGDQLAKDFAGTLKLIAAIGYREVELASTYGKTAAELKTAFRENGLNCRSAHLFDFQKTPAQFMDFAQELGVKYVVSSFNPPPSALEPFKSGKPDMQAFLAALEGMTAGDYKKSAETCNSLGEEAKKRGLQYAYHNHNLEFKKFGGVTAYDTLIGATDPELVKFEMDCGWVTAAGYDPIAYLKKYPGRYRLLHIKNFKPGPPTTALSGPNGPKPTELGRGGIDYKPILVAAKEAEIEQYYVEQEPPFTEMPAMEAIKVDYEYLRGLRV